MRRSWPHYRTELTRIGAQILFVDKRATVARTGSGEQSIWISIDSQETSIEITVIEEKPFQPSLKPPEAAAMKPDLDKSGRITRYVPCDFDKTTLKPEAAPVLAAVVKLVTDTPDLQCAIEGHTDSFGTHDYNVKLSNARCNAVMAALIASGIGADRLSASFLGPDKPIAGNAATERRARNRTSSWCVPDENARQAANGRNANRANDVSRVN